jgi:hypothetical protein
LRLADVANQIDVNGIQQGTRSPNELAIGLYLIHSAQPAILLIAQKSFA